MDPVAATEAVQGNGGLIGTLTTIVLAAGWWLRNKKPQEDRGIAAATAEVGIIEQLRSECKRLSEQNAKLAESLNKFQLQIMDLQTENMKLHREANAFREENLSLREEIVELRKELQDLGAEVLKMSRGKDD